MQRKMAKRRRGPTDSWPTLRITAPIAHWPDSPIWPIPGGFSAVLGGQYLSIPLE